MSNDEDAGTPLPDFRAANIQLQTVAPALGVTGGTRSPDYLEYDTKGRGVVVTLFANSGVAYLMGIAGGGAYGFRHGLASTPSSVSSRIMPKNLQFLTALSGFGSN